MEKIANEKNVKISELQTELAKVREESNQKNKENLELENKIKEFEKEIIEKNEEIDNLNKKIKKFESVSNNKNNNNNINDDNQEFHNQSKLIEQEKEIGNLKVQIAGNIKLNDIKPDEKHLVINITSKDENISFAVICKTSTMFSEIERCFYEKYPDYCKNEEDICIFRSHVLVRGFRTMAENGFPGYEIKVERKNLGK